MTVFAHLHPSETRKAASSLPARRRWRTEKYLFLAALILLLAGPTALHAQPPTVPGRVALTDSIRPVAPMGAASKAVPAALSRSTLLANEAATPFHIGVILKMRHFAELQRRVTVGETISRAEMAARFLPRENDYQSVARWLTAQGLTVTSPGAGHALVRASGTPAQLERAFQTHFARVTFQGVEYTAAVTAPSLPTEIEAQVSSIHGLQPYLHPHKTGAPRQAAVSADIEPPYMVSDILRAYNVTTGALTGAGQQIGIVIDTVPHDSDLTQFWTANGVGQSLGNIITVNVEGNTLPSPTGEETLDVSWSSGIASGAQIVIYACGNLDNANDAYSRILDDLQDGSYPNLHQISMSYGSGEETDETPADMKSVNQLFTAIAAYGVSLFAASGDDGAYADGDHVLQVLYPASDPNVTGVGGTTLFLNSATGAVATETGWTTSSAASDGDKGSSGGGISGYFARPAWQVGSTVPGGTTRLVPDVAFAADPNYGCYLVVKGEIDQYGGTSWGAPSWAGLCALINQARATAGQSALGVTNPFLYPLLGTASFRDITSGYNGAYSAEIGYDMVTGLGVPDFAVLEPALVMESETASAPAITSALTSSGTTGRTFSYQITASHSPTSFAASSLPPGLSVNASTGVISGAPTASGAFPVGLSATNGGGTGTATLNLTVALAPPVVAIGSPTVSGQTGGSFTYQIVASNQPTSYAASGLPAGLSLNTSSGLVSGTPTATGIFSVLLSATNPDGTGTGTLTLSITPPVPVFTNASSPLTASGQVGQPFATYTISATNSPTSFDAMGLPAGLSVNTSTGTITGTPTVAGTFAVTLTATNNVGSSTAILTLTVAPYNPMATVAATTPTVTIGSGTVGVFTVSLSAARTSDTVINYTLQGTAVNGTDYVLLTGTKTIKAGKTSKPIKIVPLGNLDGAAKKTIKLTVGTGSDYTVGTAATAKVKILAASE